MTPTEKLAFEEAWNAYNEKRPRGDISCDRAYRAGWEAALSGAPRASTPQSEAETADIRWAVNVLLETIAKKFEANDTLDIWRSDAASLVRSFKHALSPKGGEPTYPMPSEGQIRKAICCPEGCVFNHNANCASHGRQCKEGAKAVLALLSPKGGETTLTGSWRDIDTAPKDGTKFLWFDENGEGGISYCVINWPEYSACFDVGYWQPLPAPPDMDQPTLTGPEGER